MILYILLWPATFESLYHLKLLAQRAIENEYDIYSPVFISLLCCNKSQRNLCRVIWTDEGSSVTSPGSFTQQILMFKYDATVIFIEF